MSMNWISKVQEKQSIIYPNCDKKKKYHIPVSKGLQIPYTQNPGRAWMINYATELAPVVERMRSTIHWITQLVFLFFVNDHIADAPQFVIK